MGSATWAASWRAIGRDRGPRRERALARRRGPTPKAVLCSVVAWLLAPAASAELLVWECELDESQVRNGPARDGSTDSPGRATARLELDTETNALSIRIEWRDLVGSLRKLHVHGPAVPSRSNPRHAIELLGPPKPAPEQAGTSGRFETRLTLTTLEHAGQRPLTPAEARRILESGLAYLNLHTSVFGGGEIRGNLGKPVRGERAQGGDAGRPSSP